MGRHSTEGDEPHLEIPGWQQAIGLGIIAFFAILGVWCIVVEFFVR